MANASRTPESAWCGEVAVPEASAKNSEKNQYGSQRQKETELTAKLHDLTVLRTESPARRPPTCGFPKENVSPGLSPADPVWEMLDPTPDIHALLRKFNADYFENTLGKVKVRWTNKLKSDAGNFRKPDCMIRLSLPLLKFRPRNDLVATLLHEMIHAYLFVTNKDDGHGDNFLEEMSRVNQLSGANITVEHSYHDEVEYHLQHIWRCNGPCRLVKPHFGYFRRARNLPPGPTEDWWAAHVRKCSGAFIKIKEPKGFASRKRKTPDDDDYNKYHESCGELGPPPAKLLFRGPPRVLVTPPCSIPLSEPYPSDLEPPGDELEVPAPPADPSPLGLPPASVPALAACIPPQISLPECSPPFPSFSEYESPPSAAPIYGPTPSGVPVYGPCPPNPIKPVYGPPAVLFYGPPLYASPGYGPPPYGVPSMPRYWPPLYYGPHFSGQLGYGPPPYGLPGYGRPTDCDLVYGSVPSSFPVYGSRPPNQPVYAPPFSGVPGYGPQPSAVPGPGYGYPPYGWPVYGSSQSSVAVYGSPSSGMPVCGSSSPVAPVYGTSRAGMSVYGTPSYGMPVHVQPQLNAPQQGLALSGMPAYRTPAYSFPVFGPPTRTPVCISGGSPEIVATSPPRSPLFEPYFEECESGSYDFLSTGPDYAL